MPTSSDRRRRSGPAHHRHRAQVSPPWPPVGIEGRRSVEI